MGQAVRNRDLPLIAGLTGGLRATTLTLALVGSIIIAAFSFSGCREDFSYTETVVGLEFSHDTLVLDTTFVDVSTPTYSLKVFNRNREDIVIRSVRLESGSESPYRLNLNGAPGKAFEDVILRGKDSMYVFVEFTPLAESTVPDDLVIKDRILFEDAEQAQYVTLLTYVKNATVLYPGYPGSTREELEQKELENLPFWLDSDEVFTLGPADLQWSSEQAVVIYGVARIRPGDTLRIGRGSRIYFHQGAGLMVPEGAVMIAQGGGTGAERNEPENQVRFLSDQLRPGQDEIPGLWGGIYLGEGATAVLDHVLISNANYAIALWSTPDGPTPVLNLAHSELVQSEGINLWSRLGEINAVNCVFGNAGISSVYLEGIRQGTFEHCTIANYWTLSFRPQPALFMGAYAGIDPGEASISLVNCIVDGNKSREIGFGFAADTPVDVSLVYTLIKYQSVTDSENTGFYDFTDASIYNHILLNGQTQFREPEVNNFDLDETSAAIDFAIPLPSERNANPDIRGQVRNMPPDAGAFEFRPLPDEQPGSSGPPGP